MEKLINSISAKISLGKDKNGDEQLRGLCLRYSTGRDKWVCGYGTKMKKFANPRIPNYTEADDPVEALAFFVELLNKKQNT